MVINAGASSKYSSGCTLKIQFVRGHEDTVGNEEIDVLATEAIADPEAHRQQDEESGARLYPKTIMRAMVKTHARRSGLRSRP